MKESFEHAELREMLFEWIDDYCKNTKKMYSISMDHAGDECHPSPPRIDNFVPDIFVKFLASENIVIGEAETSQSLLGRHTEEQIKGFLRYCSLNKHSIFFLAVPWDLVRRAKALLRILKSEISAEGVRSIVIEKHGK